jgi:hypothetical protein
MAEVAPRASDIEVMSRAQRENRLLLTEDKDFGDLVFRQGRLVPGIVLVRIEPSRRSHKGPRLMAAIDHFGNTFCLVAIQSWRRPDSGRVLFALAERSSSSAGARSPSTDSQDQRGMENSG